MNESDNIPAVWQRFGEVCGTSPHEARRVLAESVMPKGTDAERLAFIAVCGQYGLNPLRKEIYAFPSQGKVVPVVGIDGWLAIATRHPEHDAIETEEIREGGKLVAVKALVWKKGSSRPTTATEYLSECQRSTQPWKQWPCRMLTTKAMIQAIRRAYAVSGIMEQDEAERMAPEPRVADARATNREVLLGKPEAVEVLTPEDAAPMLDAIDDEIGATASVDGMDDWAKPVSGDPEAAQ